MACEYELIGICLARPPAEPGLAIFGFAEFLAALALLVLVFNSSDFLYRFRVSIAPIPLFPITFGATVAIGLGSLLTDLWFAERWYSLPWGVSRSVIQAVFGLLFLATALLWMWFAFIRPPIFSRWNCKQFNKAVFQVIVRGSDTHLPILAAELARSGYVLVQFAAGRGADQKSSPAVADYAHDALFMFANRKLCRHIVSSSPITAIFIMQAATKLKKYHLPIGDFASNITTEAILNRDSILYHEDNYGTDLVGHVQPFTTAMYADYRLVEGARASGNSPLDIHWRMAWGMDGEQFEAYCRIVLTTFKNYIETGRYINHSYSIYRAMDRIKYAGQDLYKLNDVPADTLDNKFYRRLSAAVDFVKEVVTFLEEQEGLRFGHLRIDKKGSSYRRENIFDDIANLMFELIHSAAYVRSGDYNWTIQHNTVWNGLFIFRKDGPAWNVLRFKLFRLIFDEIKQMEEFPNYKGARILSFCLNVMGLREPARGDYGKEYYSLHKAVVSWTRKNYLRLTEVQPDVAEHCLAEGTTFDAEHQRLVKTFTGGLRTEPTYVYLDLCKPKSRRADGAGRKSLKSSRAQKRRDPP